MEEKKDEKCNAPHFILLQKEHEYFEKLVVFELSISHFSYGCSIFHNALQIMKEK
jgi:hypothetical protein